MLNADLVNDVRPGSAATESSHTATAGRLRTFCRIRPQRTMANPCSPFCLSGIKIQMFIRTSLRYSSLFFSLLSFFIFFSSQALTVALYIAFSLQVRFTLIDHAFHTILRDLFSLCVNNIDSLCPDGITRFHNSAQQCSRGPEA